MIGVFKVEDRLGRRLVVILRGFPCAYGQCSFCPFAMEQSMHTSRVLGDNTRIIVEALEAKESYKPGRIAVFNGGSFHELPYDTVEKLRPLASGVVFEVEERSEYITLDSLRTLAEYYKPLKLIVRIGFETASEYIREKILRKGMPDRELHRISKVRMKAREAGLPVELWSYLLFGMKGIPEETVKESLRLFKTLFDGVIAVRYRKYLPGHPEPSPVSRDLGRLLEEEADLVDWGGDQWVISGISGDAP